MLLAAEGVNTLVTRCKDARDHGHDLGHRPDDQRADGGGVRRQD